MDRKQTSTNCRLEPTPQVRRSFLRMLVVAAGALVVSACISPTLPLPPPSQPEVTSPDDSGMIHIRGTVRPKSEVFAKNRNSLDIVGKETDETGKYDLTMPAEVNDRIIVWYTEGGEDSDFAEVVVPPSDDVGAAGSSNQ